MIFSPVNFFVDTLYILYELFIHRKMTIEIGVENLILKSLHTESQCVTEFVILGKNLTVYQVIETNFPHEGISNYFFPHHFSPSCLEQKWQF